MNLPTATPIGEAIAFRHGGGVLPTRFTFEAIGVLTGRLWRCFRSGQLAMAAEEDGEEPQQVEQQGDHPS